MAGQADFILNPQQAERGQGHAKVLGEQPHQPLEGGAFTLSGQAEIVNGALAATGGILRGKVQKTDH